MATEDEAPQPAASTEEASGQEAEDLSGTRLRGVVKWFNASKGFGFIQPEDNEAGEVFVHQTSIDAEGFRSLLEGEAVEFEVEVGDDGRRKAVRVTGPEGRPVQGVPRRAPVLGEYGAPLEYGMMAAQDRGYGGYPGHPMPIHPAYMTYMGGFPTYPPGPGMPMGGRGGYGQGAPGRGFGRGPPGERRPPPGTPGVSSGLQVVVHNLPWSCTWQMLKDVFSETPGVVRADVIIDGSGRSRGFGTVRYSTPEEAQHSVELMNNVEIGGRTCSVRIDRFA